MSPWLTCLLTSLFRNTRAYYYRIRQPPLCYNLLQYAYKKHFTTKYKLAKTDFKNGKNLSNNVNFDIQRGKTDFSVKIKILELADFFRFQNAIRA